MNNIKVETSQHKSDKCPPMFYLNIAENAFIVSAEYCYNIAETEEDGEKVFTYESSSASLGLPFTKKNGIEVLMKLKYLDPCEEVALMRDGGDAKDEHESYNAQVKEYVKTLTEFPPEEPL